MPTVRLRADILRADRTSADRWYVTNGATAVGPVQLDLVERGIEAGKIPVESYIRHEMWKIWRPLSELCVTHESAPIDPNGTPVMPFPIPYASDSGEFDPRQTTMKPAMSVPRVLPDLRFPSGHDPLVMFAPVSEAPEALDPMSPSEPQSARLPAILAPSQIEEIEPDAIETPTPARVPSAAPSVEDITLPARPPGRNEKMAGDAQNATAQLKDALLTLSGVILHEVGCEGVMVHRVDDEGAVAVVAHGPRMFDVLGLRTRLLDPAIVAAASGILVVAEPSPGPAGAAVLSRLVLLGVRGSGAVMIPIRPKGRLFGTVELGQAAPFDGAAIAKAEAFVRVVQAKMEAADWKLDG